MTSAAAEEVRACASLLLRRPRPDNESTWNVMGCFTYGSDVLTGLRCFRCSKARKEKVKGEQEEAILEGVVRTRRLKLRCHEVETRSMSEAGCEVDVRCVC